MDGGARTTVVQKQFTDTSAMIHLPVVIEKVHFSPCTNFTNFSGLRDDDRENFFLLPFTSHPRLTHRQDRNVSLKLRTSNRGIYKF